MFIAIITVVGLAIIERINHIYFPGLTWSGVDLLTVLFGGALATFAALVVLLSFEGLYGNPAGEDEREHAEKALMKSKAILSRAQVIAHIGNSAWNLKTNAIT